MDGKAQVQGASAKTKTMDLFNGYDIRTLIILKELALEFDELVLRDGSGLFVCGCLLLGCHWKPMP